MPAPLKDPVTGKFVKADAVSPKPEPPKPDATPSPEPKPEDVDMTATKEFVAGYLGREGKTLEVEKPKPKEETPPKPKAKPTPKPTAPVADKPLTAADIASATAKAVAEAMKPAAATTKEPEPKSDGLSAKDKRTVSVLERLEKLYPDEYKGVSGKYQESLKALVEYADKWEKENPGREFDQDAPEHEDFFKSNDVEWDDADYAEAQADMRAEKLLEEDRKKTNAKLSELERKEKFRESAPAIQAEIVHASRTYWDAFGDDYKKVIAENGQVSQEEWAKLLESDPHLGFRVASAKDLAIEVPALYGLLNGLVSYDDKNPVHAELAKFGAAQEQKLMAMPREAHDNGNGQTFLPADQYWKLDKEQRARHWTFNARDLAVLRADFLAKEAKQKIESEEKKLEAYAKARGYTLPEKRPKPQNGQPAEPEDEPLETNEKPSSPAAGSGTRLAASATKGAGDQKDPLQTIADRYLGVR